MGKLYDVIIAGAGPVGLLLACELKLARASVLVLERDNTAESPWKRHPIGFRGLNTLSVETFYRRGLLGKLFGKDRPSSFQQTTGFKHGGHFAGIMLNSNKLELDRWRYCVNGPALSPGSTTIERIEAVLTDRAQELGVKIRRGAGVTSFTTQDDSVTVEAGDETFSSRWLVGCDGGRSTIRKAAEFNFVGTEPKFTGYTIHCDLDHPEKMKPGFNVTKHGVYVSGPGVLYLLDFDGGAAHRTRVITQEHIQEMLNRIRGETDVNITKLHLSSSYTDRSRQVTNYRKGRVLLAGDAAHIHPPMGQGLNAGLGDAMNLGWKLAATVHHELNSGSPANLTLLDTYETERHPVGAWVIEWTRAQTMAMQPDLHSQAVFAVYKDLLNTTDGTNMFLEHFWGLSQRYDLGSNNAHPLVGRTAPDFELLDGSRLGPKLESGRGLLISFEDTTSLRDLSTGERFNDRVDYVGIDAKDRRGLSALLVRPDGIVAWVAEEAVENGDLEVAKASLEQWF